MLDSVDASSYSTVASVSIMATSRCTPDLVARGVDLCWGLGLPICNSPVVYCGWEECR